VIEGEASGGRVEQRRGAAERERAESRRQQRRQGRARLVRDEQSQSGGITEFHHELAAESARRRGDRDGIDARLLGAPGLRDRRLLGVQRCPQRRARKLHVAAAIDCAGPGARDGADEEAGDRRTGIGGGDREQGAQQPVVVETRGVGDHPRLPRRQPAGEAERRHRRDQRLASGLREARDRIGERIHLA
jgi:hypothetical protein